MWETTARARVTAVANAAPDRVWSLLRSAQAWSLRRRSCLTFDLPGPGDARNGGGDAARPDSGGLRFYLGETSPGVAAAVLQITQEVPGELISLQTADRRWSWELSVSHGRRGTSMHVAASRVVSRDVKVDHEHVLRDSHKAWLKSLCAVCEGQRPWPGSGMPEALRQACLASAPVAAGVLASASTEVNAPPDRVREAFDTLGFIRSVQPESLLCCGDIPGMDGGQLGGMRYYVYRRASGELSTAVSLRAASSPSGLVVRRVTPPCGETTTRFEPSGAGTRLEFTQRCPASPKCGDDAHRDGHATQLAEMARRYQAALESLPGLAS